MTTIARVIIEAPADGPFLAQWPQPFRTGEDELDWYVTTGITTRRVQRDRLTDRVHLCQVLVEAGTTLIDVETGVVASPAPAWSTPTLTGLALRFHGRDGSRSDALLDGTGPGNVDVVRRDGEWSRSTRRWVTSRVAVQGSGTDVVGTEVLGVHAYLRYRADFPGLVELDVRISNACATVGTQGAGLGADWLGHAYLTGGELVLPAGWAYVEQRPLPAPGGDAPLYSKTATVRRWVLYDTGDPSNLSRAQQALELYGLGRAAPVTGLSSYHSVISFLAQDTILPNLDLGFTFAGQQGYEAARTYAHGRYLALSAAVAAGVNSNLDYLQGLRSGWYHALGEKDPQAVGGTDIQTHSGLPQVREWALYQRLRGDLRTDAEGVFLYDRATGEPLRSRDFGDAYTVAGSHPGYVADPAYLGRQPFSFYIQNNTGYEYGTKRTAAFARWFPPVWPPHELDARPTLPGGANNPSYDKWIPSDPGTWPSAPRSLNAYTSVHDANMLSRWTPHPLHPTGNWFISISLGHRDPSDAQHFSRTTRDRKAVAWLVGDLVSIDDIDMFAEWAGLHFSEVGHVPLQYPDSGQFGDLNSAPNNFSLVSRLPVVQQFPFVALGNCGRADGWIGELLASQFALSSVAKRDDGYPAKGIRKRAEMMFELLWKTTAGNGATYRLPFSAAGGSGQLAEAWDPSTGVFYGSPAIPQQFQICQIGLETPIVMHGLFALARQLGRMSDAGVQVLQAARSHTGRTSLYVPSIYNEFEWGPMKYAGVWDEVSNAPTLGATMPRAFTGTGNPGHPNHMALVEYAFRLSGDITWFTVANMLGFRSPGATPLARGAQLLSFGDDWRFNLGTIAYLFGQAGADSATALPPQFEDLGGVLQATLSLQGVLSFDVPDTGGGTGEPGEGQGSGGGGSAPPPVVEFDSEADQGGDNVLLTWSVAGGDFRIVNNDLQRESGLASAVLISLFSDRRIDSDPTKPIELQDLRGWWGEAQDDQFGSRLWLLEREKATRETLGRAVAYAKEALAWMVSERIARDVRVTAAFGERHVIILHVEILRGDARRWAKLWAGALDIRIRARDVLLQVVGLT